VQRFDKRGLVDDLAAGDVGDVRALWVGFVEEFEFGGGEEVGCCFAVGKLV
jgi:hypothetical protein